MLKLSLAIVALTMCLTSFEQSFTMPAETLPHEGTWLQWPHQYEYGTTYRNRLDLTWVAMTSALIQSEKVHIIAYNATEQTRITNLLTAASVSLANVNFKLFKTNDVWVRDNGPIYVRDANNDLKIEDWGFNGWGGKYNYNYCNPIPTSVATATGMTALNLNATMTIEGGAYELDGNGVFLACKSSTLSQTPANSVRNPGMTQAQAEIILAQYIGVSKFIWLDGGFSADDVTDMHIDGFAKFANDTTLVTMNAADLTYWGLSAADTARLYAASNVNNKVYHKVYLPLTQNDVVTTYGNNLGYKGSYCNYYIGNTVVLVPNYNDPNDAVANAIVQTLHPGRTVVGIDVRNLYENGGMVHCVTQQQPAANIVTPISLINFEGNLTENTVALKWTTTTEKDNHYFDIERSIDGTHFIKIETIKATGNSSAAQKYSYTDTHLPANYKIYYRLKQTDADNHFTYSPILSFSKKKLTGTINVFPNPAKTHITLSGFSNKFNGEIYNWFGQLIKKQNAIMSNTKISIADLPGGFYFIKLTDTKNAKTFQTGKFVKI